MAICIEFWVGNGIHVYVFETNFDFFVQTLDLARIQVLKLENKKRKRSSASKIKMHILQSIFWVADCCSKMEAV